MVWATRQQSYNPPRSISRNCKNILFLSNNVTMEIRKRGKAAKDLYFLISGSNPGPLDAFRDRSLHHRPGLDVLLPIHRHQHHPPVHRWNIPNGAELGRWISGKMVIKWLRSPARRKILIILYLRQKQLVRSIPRLSAPSCHLLGKINAMGTFYSTRHLCLYQNDRPWWRSQMSRREECSHSIDFSH